MKTIRRLVVSLDGTWNNRDDSTNVLYSHSLAFECREKEWEIVNKKRQAEKVKVTQERYYQEGVGTGPLDRLTGGGFGFGLDKHVRDAYNWLVQSFEDGGGPEENPADEIYIFGFSRGAYTARSLVGFISMCGLLRRGAPLTVSQLWENYCILGLAREERSGGFMSGVFGKPTAKFRRITDLTFDPWDRRGGGPVATGALPKLRDGVALKPTEDLLVRWSRRVKITYLGVFDTVGAVGWDALAIPGLRSKLAVQHNMRPSTIIQKCRHALAIDEQRSSFNHTPFVAYKGAKDSNEELAREENDREEDPVETRPRAATNWEQAMAIWNRKIEQRWFVGAHSNIGGGYADNRLAQRPLEWMLDGAREARRKNEGLICEKIPTPEPLSPAKAPIRDSFAEFAAPLWAMILRGKRNYRSIRPQPELRANRDEADKKKLADIRAGFALVNINEQVDESVVQYWAESPTAPPNLIESAPRTGLTGFTGKPIENVWPGKGFAAQFALVLWSTFAAAGLAAANNLFCIWPGDPPVLLLGGVAFFFSLVDWAESSTNSFLARKGTTPPQRSLLDSIYWTRALGVVLFAFGVIGVVVDAWSTGWHSTSFANAGDAAWELLQRLGKVAAGGAIGALIANAFNKSLSKVAFGAAFIGLATTPLIAGLTVIIANGLGHVITAALGNAQTGLALIAVPEPVRMAGLLLLLQMIFAYFVRAFVWVGEPLAKANLGSITPLQWNLKPAGVKDCLDRWSAMLGNHENESASENAMIGILRQALWRDCFGFIPVYSGLLLFGLWFAAIPLKWAEKWGPMEYLWFIIPLASLCCDYLENLCHFRYLSLRLKKEEPSSVTTFFAISMTSIKTIAFVAGILMVALAILCASGHIAWNPKAYGLRGLAALLLTTATLAGTAALILWGLGYRIWNKLESEKQGQGQKIR